VVSCTFFLSNSRGAPETNISNFSMELLTTTATHYTKMVHSFCFLSFPTRPLLGPTPLRPRAAHCCLRSMAPTACRRDRLLPAFAPLSIVAIRSCCRSLPCIACTLLWPLRSFAPCRHATHCRGHPFPLLSTPRGACCRGCDAGAWGC
jgi:hypothetical protein